MINKIDFKGHTCVAIDKRTREAFEFVERGEIDKRTAVDEECGDR